MSRGQLISIPNGGRKKYAERLIVYLLRACYTRRVEKGKGKE